MAEQKLRIVGHGPLGVLQVEQFPGLLKAAFKSLVTSVIHAKPYPGPAVTAELLGLMKAYLLDGVSIGEHRYAVMVRTPKVPEGKKSRPFFVLVPHGVDILSHSDGTLQRLQDF